MEDKRISGIESAGNGSRALQFLPMGIRDWRDLGKSKRVISNRRVSMENVTGTQTNCSMILICFMHRGQRANFLAQSRICTSSVFYSSAAEKFPLTKHLDPDIECTLPSLFIASTCFNPFPSFFHSLYNDTASSPPPTTVVSPPPPFANPTLSLHRAASSEVTKLEK